MESPWYLAYKSKSGNLMYLGLINNKPRQVGGKHLAKSFSSQKEANDFKEAYNINAVYVPVQDK